ncbi:acetyl-CoA carboxylase biotin carboxyl carrier protein [Streptococcus himalayensis]|uniref:Biotin carboxyl carrier protein of acetyl-CoA carboxylase n=1 Tax=Streptococcus himalayensis TaxID=1888195 RepID=A0A917EEU6_9STRE|nr:acetyl-CoA carboxylase biotin carboxyl carrier protein [Streptococcus himalayensis]GGE25891.1 acetyl-CoA carboxylase biotin carboxyl carrier protein subunit [Streptococcus himalayensis]
MKIDDIKDLMAQFDQSSLREFSYKQEEFELTFSKNETKLQPLQEVEKVAVPQSGATNSELSELVEATPSQVEATMPEGEVVESPLVGVAYLASGPDKPAFVQVGDRVQKGQTLLIIEAMKVMNEVPAPRDGVVTEILVANEEMVEYGKGLVRLA